MDNTQRDANPEFAESGTGTGPGESSASWSQSQAQGQSAIPTPEPHPSESIGGIGAPAAEQQRSITEAQGMVNPTFGAGSDPAYADTTGVASADEVGGRYARDATTTGASTASSTGSTSGGTGTGPGTGSGFGSGSDASTGPEASAQTGTDDPKAERGREIADQLKPVALAAEEITAKAVDISAKGLTKVAAFLQKRRQARDAHETEGGQDAQQAQTGTGIGSTPTVDEG